MQLRPAGSDRAVKKTKYLIITDIPTPWREPVFERVAARLRGSVEALYFRQNEKRRLWTFDMGRHPRKTLKSFTFTIGSSDASSIPGILTYLLRRRPHVALVFTSFKDPSGWLALLLCRTDGHQDCVAGRQLAGSGWRVGRLQRWARSLSTTTSATLSSDPADRRWRCSGITTRHRGRAVLS